MDIRYEKSPNHTVEHFFTDEPTSELGLLAAKVAYYNFEWRFLTIVMFNIVHAIGLETFLKHYQQSVIVKLGRYLPARRSAVPQIVMFGEGSTEISSTLRWTVKSKYDSNGRFIIICAYPDQDCDEQKIFQTLQTLYITNVLLLKMSNSTNEPLAYSYRLVSHGKCKNTVPYKVNLSTSCKYDECFKELYPEKLSNFHKCRLIISTIEQPPYMYLHNGTKSPSGTDADIMKIAADMLNATLVLQTPADRSDSGRYINNNWTGSLGEVYNGRKHASVCSVPLTSNKYGNFQISFTYYSMDIVWATRLPPQRATWEKLLHPLNFDIRIILFFIFICIILINTLCKIKKWRSVVRAFKIEPPKYSLLFYSWLLFLGMPILRTPARNSLFVTVYTWIWFCFIVRSAYQAALVNSLKQPAYMKNIQNFQEVLREGYPYGGLSFLKEYYTDDRAIYDNWIGLDSDRLYAILDSILDGTTDFVLAANKEVIKHHIKKYNGTKLLQIIPEKIVNSPTVVYFKKFSPLTSPMNSVLRIAQEAGFIQQTYDRYLDRDEKVLRRFSTRHSERLRMEHFSGCFVVLILGWFLSITYFAVEYVCGNLID